jgi:starch-binding outer membrane protein SusE/F
MKRIALIFCLTAALAVNSFSECGSISLIGEFSNWAEDHFMAPDPVIPDQFNVLITFTLADDMNQDGIIELKFRQDASWNINWGSEDFPVGYGIQDGPDIPALYGSYYVTFNCGTGYYYFESVSGDISIIGEFNNYMGDIYMFRDSLNHNLFTLPVSFVMDDDPNQDGYMDMKFRENGDWMNNWGGIDFPQGTGILNGPVLSVPYGNYIISFNRNTLAYNFEVTIGLEDTYSMVKDVIVCPNPASRDVYFIFRSPNNGKTCQVTLMDMTGRIIGIKSKTISESERTIHLDVSQCPKGFYTYRLTAGGHTTGGKLVLAR